MAGFRRSGESLRNSIDGLNRFIGTTRTAKFRVFQFLPANLIAESKIVVIATEDPHLLGVLSSRIHILFSTAAGGWLGVGNDPTYNHLDCFNKFPFPICGEAEKARIRKLADELDAHRKRAIAQHGLTITDLYNVLEKLRAGSARTTALPHPNPLPLGEGIAPPRPGQPIAPDSNPALRTILPLPAGEGRGEGERSSKSTAPITLTAKEKQIHDQGLVSVLKQLHDDLDAAVFAAYGWVRGGQPEITLTDAEILERLVALNAERAAEEKRGVIHWLRPEYQTRNQKFEGGGQKAEVRSQSEMSLPEGKTKPAARKTPRSALRTPKLNWPKRLVERVQAVETALHAAPGPVTPADLATQFTRAKPEDVAEILETLVTLGRAHRKGDQFTR